MRGYDKYRQTASLPDLATFLLHKYTQLSASDSELGTKMDVPARSLTSPTMPFQVPLIFLPCFPLVTRYRS